jgi:hypothetical protein
VEGSGYPPFFLVCFVQPLAKQSFLLRGTSGPGRSPMRLTQSSKPDQAIAFRCGVFFFSARMFSARKEHYGKEED